MRTCHVCRARLRASTIPEARGAVASARIELKGMPCLACPAGHERVYYWPEFAAALSAAIWAGAAMPVADTVGLLKTTHTCAACHAPLTDPARRPHTETGFVRALPDWPAFAPVEVTLTAPAATCPACGRVQLVFTESLVDVEDAMDAAFTSVDLKP